MKNVRPKKGYGYIYKYTSPSGKSYIGQTKRTLAERAGARGKGYRDCPIFHQAILKYGFENFEVSILAEVKIEQLDEMEQKYIHLFNTVKPNGYNDNEGGQCGNFKPYKKVYQYDKETGKLLNEYLGIREAAEEYNLNYQALAGCLQGFTYTCGDYCWSYIKMDKYPINERMLSPESTEVKMFDMNNNLIQTFSSIARVAQYVNGDRNAIKRVCRGELQSAYGYKWSCTEVINEKKYNNTAKKIAKVNKDTNEVLEVFPSISAAAKSLNKETSLLRRVLNNETRTAYGYRWKTVQGSTTKDS